MQENLLNPPEENHEDHEIPTPLPFIENKLEEHPDNIEPVNKYTQQITKKPKKSQLERKKSVDLMKKTNKVNRSDILSKIEAAELRDQSNPNNQKYMPFDGFKGPAAKRKMTNCICLVIFLILNGGLFINAILVFVAGSSNRLMNGTDFRAEICGVDQRADRPYLYYIEPTVDTNVAICVSNCPNSTGTQICLYEQDANTLTPYCYTQIQTKVRGKYCIPTEPINKAAIETELEKLDGFIKRVAGDLGQSADIVCLGCFLSVFLAYFFQEIFKSEKYIKFVVWGCVWGTVFCIMVLAIMCYMEYKRTINFSCLFGIDKYDCGGLKASGFFYSFVGLLCLIGVYLLIVMKVFNSINLAIGIIKASGKVTRVLEQMKKIPFIMIMIALGCGVFLFTMIIMAFSVGEIKIVPAKNINGGLVKIIEYNNTYRLCLIGDIFMLIYWLLFIIGYSDLVTSYSLCIWFFTKKKDTVMLPVKRALKDAFLYHLGTVLLIVVINPLSMLPKAFINLMKSILKKSNQKSPFIKFIISSMMCCFYCFDHFFRYFSYQTYVQVVMWSLPHGKASQKAFFLINRHKSELRDIDFLQRFVIFQAKLCCSLLSCIFVYIFISFSDTSIIGKDLKAVETPFGPAIFVLFIAFFFSTIFQGSFDIISKSILQCYLMDIEMFIGDQRFIEPFLRDFLHFFGLKAEQQQIEVEAEKPKYIIGVSVQPLPVEMEPVKPDLDIEDLSEEESEEKSEESEQSIELMPTTTVKKKHNPSTGASRPDTGQSGVEGFQQKKVELGPGGMFLDDNINKGKKGGVNFDPFSYNAPIKPIASRPQTKDANPQIIDIRPNSQDVNKNQEVLRPASKDLRPNSKGIDYNLRPNSKGPDLFSNNNLRPNSKGPDLFSSNNLVSNNNLRPNSKGPDLFRPNSKGPDLFKPNAGTTGSKLELIESRPVSKDAFINNSMRANPANERPNSKDLFMMPKMDESIGLFNKSRMNDDTIKFENFDDDVGKNNNNNKNNYRLN